MQTQVKKLQLYSLRHFQVAVGEIYRAKRKIWLIRHKRNIFPLKTKVYVEPDNLELPFTTNAIPNLPFYVH